MILRKDCGGFVKRYVMEYRLRRKALDILKGSEIS